MQWLCYMSKSRRVKLWIICGDMLIKDVINFLAFLCFEEAHYQIMSKEHEIR